MKALVKREAARGLWMQDVPRPAVGTGDVLVKVQKTAICGTDLHIYNWDAWAQKTIPVPMVIGHEFMGTVAEVGADVVDYRPGDRVTAEGHITCGHCRNCRAGRRHLCRKTKGVGVNRPGCFAEYVSIPASNIFKLPPDIPDEVAAIFDPYGNATHTALSFDLIGEDVLITGAGPIGVMATAICRHVGARYVVVTDVNDYRLGLAEKLGATCVVNPTRGTLNDAMRRLGMTEGFDVGLEMSGNAQAFQSMLESMNHGGRIAMLGIFAEPVPLDSSQVIFKGLHLKGIYGREMFETWYKMTTMLQSGLDISGVITHALPVNEFARGFELVAAGQSGKVILDW
ncbi:MAG TPA: L-threonine 3-dehydrogenase [Pirellulales bacterium]|nr:L-threonine 3-dehydrogenase [Pirellulales bacterium]